MFKGRNSYAVNNWVNHAVNHSMNRDKRRARGDGRHLYARWQVDGGCRWYVADGLPMVRAMQRD